MPFGRITHYELCPHWHGGECACAKLRREMDTCEDCKWNKYRDRFGKLQQVLTAACSRHQKRSETQWISMGDKYWAEHEDQFEEVRRERGRRAQEREERRLMEKFRRPFEGAQFDADLRRL